MSAPPNRQLPPWTSRLIRTCCAEGWREEIEGDLLELQALRQRQYGPSWARLVFLKDALLFLRPYTLRRPVRPAIAPVMFRNNLLVSLRNLRKQPLYSAINVFGLSVGMAVSILLLLFVRHELSYDNFHENGERLYRLGFTIKEGAESYERKAAFSPAVAPALAEDYPVVERAVRIWYSPGVIVHQDGRTATANATLVDPAFLDVFDFPVVRGDGVSALQEPNSVLLTEGDVARFFPDSDPIGQALTMQLADTLMTFSVRGVVADPPTNSSIQYGMLMPLGHVDDFKGRPSLTDWDDSFVSTFVLLQRGASQADLSQELPGFVERYYGHWFGGFRARGIEGEDADLLAYWIQPLADIRMDDGVEAVEPATTPLLTYLLLGIAVFILGIACINFVNLAIARASTRTREIGIRKAVGARRPQLMRQFWGEAVVLSLLALGVGVLASWLLLPIFNQLAGASLTFTPDAGLYLQWIGLAVAVGLVAGAYPALLVSGAEPTHTLRGRLKLAGRGSLWQGLIVFQFVLSVTLMVMSVFIARQVDFLRTRSLGFDTHQVVVIPLMTGEGDTAFARFRQAIGGDPLIEGLTAASTPMSNFTSRRGTTIEDVHMEAASVRVEPGFLEEMGLSLVAGNAFVDNPTQDGVVVNRRLLQRVGWTEEEALGQSFRFWGDEHATVIGVLDDFHVTSLHRSLEPTVLSVNPRTQVRFAFARVRSDAVPDALARLEEAWTSQFPDLPYNYAFLDERIERQYRLEARISTLMRYAMVFATLIACLGLFGIAALSTARRTKEIGIRKVLGATVGGVVRLTSQRFVLLVVGANLLAAPIAWLGTGALLEVHAYRIAVTPVPFLLVGAASVLLALGTVSYQSYRAARANPVESLRYE